MSAGRFPQRIKRSSCVVSIYKTPTKGYDAFTVVHYDASGARGRRMFISHAQAYRLPWDQLAYWAITVGTSIAGYAPIVGS